MLFSAVSEGKIILVGALCFAALVALVIYLPVAVIREMTQSEKEQLPEWMGTVRARRLKLRIVLVFLGLIVSFFIVAASVS